MKLSLLLATTNEGKLAELRRHTGEAWDVKSLGDVSPLPAPEEDGLTFEDNARLKALYYCQATGLPTLADDSGLCVDALEGRPGVLSARYAEDGDARVSKLLVNMRHVPPGERGARLVCALALAVPGSTSVAVEVGELRGEVSHHPRGAEGLEYDSVFLLHDGRTLAQLPPAQRALVSPRAVAVARMQRHLFSLRLKYVVLAWARWLYGVRP